MLVFGCHLERYGKEWLECEDESPRKSLVVWPGGDITYPRYVRLPPSRKKTVLAPEFL